MTPTGQPRHHVALTSTGITHRLTIDGTDVSHAVRSCTLHLATGEHPALAVEPRVVALDTTEVDSAVVLVPDATAALLVALGWTPPPHADQ
ncbi:hypothetical protein [Kitasatospora sp. NPDC090091]|uniref:hypothetical protein n=1 Tax=Kitasatospora sp. NPDC090091 TaxID=3364081 RepID=UPI003817833D